MVIKLPERITIKQPLQETAHAAEAAGRSLVSFPEEAARGAPTPGREDAAPTCQDLPTWYEMLKKNKRQIFNDPTENMRPANESLKV